MASKQTEWQKDKDRNTDKYTYRQNNILTYRKTDKQTERYTYRQTNIKADRWIEGTDT